MQKHFAKDNSLNPQIEVGKVECHGRGGIYAG